VNAWLVIGEKPGKEWRSALPNRTLRCGNSGYCPRFATSEDAVNLKTITDPMLDLMLDLKRLALVDGR
jgi:hypothetical protein